MYALEIETPYYQVRSSSTDKIIMEDEDKGYEGINRTRQNYSRKDDNV